MATAPEVQNPSLNPRQRRGRAINAVAELLRRKLAVPPIFLKPPAKLIDPEQKAPAKTFHPDVLAVDRAGSGDLHAVEIEIEQLVSSKKNWKTNDPAELGAGYNEYYPEEVLPYVTDIRDQLMSMSAHYRYLAIPQGHGSLIVGALGTLGLYSADGIGRLGVITVKDEGEDLPVAEIFISPEQFRVGPQGMIAVEKFLAKAKPDIDVRI